MYPRNAASPEPIAIGTVLLTADGTIQTSGVTVRIKPIGVSEADGKIFAAIIHGTQVIMIMIVGLISWIVMMRIPAWNKPNTP
jgi:hypothetical protein